MKKLMITMLAASAVSAAAWAEEEVTEVTFTSENFNQMAQGLLNVAAPWSYSGTATADQLKVAQGGMGQTSQYLQLNTASEKLSLAPTSAGDYAVPPESEVYFDSYVKFDAASDTIPTITDGDKLALFVLDNTDYVESGATTAFYVIGGYWDGTKLAKRLYKLNSSIANLDQFKRVSIKMYSNVLAAGAVPGFVVKIGSDVAEVAAAYEIAEDGTVDFSQAANKFEYKKYLGAASAFNSTVAASRYDSDTAQLILGLVASANPELEAVQFMGKGGIDDLAFTNEDENDDLGFGADAQLFTIDLPANVLSVKYGEDTYTSAFDITATGEKVDMTITLKDGYYYNNANPATIKVDLIAGKKLSDLIKADDLVLGVAKVGSTVYAREAFLEGDFVTAGVSENMQLLSDLDLGTGGITFVADVQLDLNGKTIGNDGSIEVVYAQDGAEVTIVGNGIVNGGVAAAEGSKISIPVTSTAKFLATVNDATVNDAAALAEMLTGKDNAKNYAFVKDGNYLVLQVTDANTDVKVEVGGSTSVEAADQDAADAIAAKVVVKVPDDVKTGLAGVEGGEAAYQALFQAKAVYNGNTKMYDITLALKGDVVTAVQTDVDTATEAVAQALSNSSATQVSVATKPGLFYGLVKQTSLNGMGTAKPGTWTMGTGAPLTFTLDKTGNCGFFKMVCSPTK